MLTGSSSGRMCLPVWTAGYTGAEHWSEGLGEGSFPDPVPPLLVGMGAKGETFPQGKGVLALALKLENKLQHL